jgi:hypothetical protein
MTVDHGLEAMPRQVMVNTHRIAHFDSSAGLPCLLVLDHAAVHDAELAAETYTGVFSTCFASVRTASADQYLCAALKELSIKQKIRQL